jgi:glutathione synthase/RimK-type ligase-like ATP-grasp enzyme
MNKDTVLIVTSSQEIAAVKVIENLQKINQSFFRIDTDLFFSKNTGISMRLDGTSINRLVERRSGEKLDLNQVKSIWFRRPQDIEVIGCNNEQERRFVQDELTSALWSLYTSIDGVYWMNHPTASRHLLERNKFLQMKHALKAGLIVPDTLITNQAEQLIRFCEDHGGTIAVKTICSKMFSKPGEETAEGIYTNKISTEYIKEHSVEISLSPIMAQEYVEKALEFRVTIVGNEIFACAIHSQDSERTKEDWRHYDFEKVKHEAYEFPAEVKNKLRAFMKRCGLSFGAVDMILTPKGEFVFLEVNPSGQFGWIESLTGLPISETIAKTLSNPPE